jgi:hypothetical protein
MANERQRPLRYPPDMEMSSLGGNHDQPGPYQITFVCGHKFAHLKGTHNL